jgi:hypothetical protein
LSATLAFAATRAFCPLIDGKPGAPLLAAEHWNGLDKLVDSAGRVLIVGWDPTARGAVMESLGFADHDSLRARVISGTPSLLVELGVIPNATEGPTL